MMSWSVPLYRLYERRVQRRFTRASLPAHIGVILDGHRRFARAEGYADYQDSYRSGMAKLKEFLGWCAQLEVPVITAWVLSTDNLRRPSEELDPYYEVLIEFLSDVPSLSQRLNFSFHVIGSLDLLPPDLVAAAKLAQQNSAGTLFRVNLALGYGGRQEIVDATSALVAELGAAGFSVDEVARRIDAEGISAHLYTSDLPDPDLVIRTSGESRLSGFLLWQAAYAECVFVDPYWPAFRRVDFLRALRDYGRRERRFGQ
jgi:short-chain Z-isoprenyl diphosphate synthase